MGSWIKLAALVLGQRDGIRHAILLTDGKNEGEEPEELDDALAAATGVFECDCRGVGTDWVVAELRKVASALLGTCDIVADPAGLQADFSAMMRQALARQVAEVVLRVWTPEGAEIVALSQLKEDEPPLDLAPLRAESGPRTGDYRTGAWQDEARDFYIGVTVPVGQVGDEMLAARVTLLAAGEPVAQQLVRAVWTDDVAKATQINRRVAVVRNEEELADVIQEVVDVHRLGDVERATDRAGLGGAHGARGRQRGRQGAHLEALRHRGSRHGSGPPQGEGGGGRHDDLRSPVHPHVAPGAPRGRAVVSATCPRGHRSEAGDYCSVCGAPMSSQGAGERVDPGPGEPACPNCGSPPSAAPNCVECGYLLGAPDSVAMWAAENWEVVVRPDRGYYEMVEPDGMEFPSETYARRIPLTGDHMRIGRSSRTKDIRPEIDLSGGLEDTGVSHRHAVLMRQPWGTWSLVDQDSTNGTFLNDDEDAITHNHPVPLSDGDRIHLGAWTTLTIERLDPAEVHLEADSRPSVDTRNITHGRRSVEIDLLGPLQLRVRGEGVPVTAAKERAVLATLALNVGASVPVLDLEWALWGEEEPKTANKAIQVYIGQLRRKLPEDTIETTQQGYRLACTKDGVDVFRFERRCGRGRTLLASGHPGAAVAELSRALELWRGEPVIDLAEGPAGTAEVVRLHERRAGAEEDLFDGRLQLGDHHGLVADLRAAVEAEPLRQRRWAQLMLALYRSGRQGDVARVQRVRGVLDHEYGVEPSPNSTSSSARSPSTGPSCSGRRPPGEARPTTPTRRRGGRRPQMVTTGQVTVRVMPSIAWIWCTTIRPRSSIEGASARAITS